MKNWEKEFDEFIDLLPARVGETPRELLKSFVRNLLTEERQRILEIIEKMDVSELMAEEVLSKLKSSIEEI